MTKVIAELFNGNLDPLRYFGKDNVELNKLEILIHRNCENLKENFDEKSIEIFEKYNDCINEYIFLIIEGAFCDGFCLGTKIFVEALTGAEQIV